MYLFDQKPKTIIESNSSSLLNQIKQSEYSVLVGRNNCGKSYLLKLLTKEWGQQSCYLGPARYNNFNVLPHYSPNRNRKQDRWNNFTHKYDKERQNFDDIPINLQTEIAQLTNEQRETLATIIDILLGAKIELKYTVDGNDMSQRYISCNGHNISFTSSGFRLIMTLITQLLDNDYDTFLIDEPELGISPEAQGIIADFLFNITKSLLGDIQRSPYRDRIFIVLDRVHQPSIKSDLIKQGVPEAGIVIWPENGIEYYYPPSIIDQVYGAGDKINILNDIVSRNGIEYKKAELSKLILDRMDANTKMHQDFNELFVTKLEAALGIKIT